MVDSCSCFGQQMTMVKKSHLYFSAVPPGYRAASLLGLWVSSILLCLCELCKFVLQGLSQGWSTFLRKVQYIYIQNFKKMVRNTWHRPVVLKECNSFAASSSESVCDRPCRLSSVSREVIPEKRDTLYIPLKLDGATQLSPTHMGLVSSLKPHVI